jgi:polyhydroxyalkanoate synthase subunit PhaC
MAVAQRSRAKRELLASVAPSDAQSMGSTRAPAKASPKATSAVPAEDLKVRAPSAEPASKVAGKRASAMPKSPKQAARGAQTKAGAPQTAQAASGDKHHADKSPSTPEASFASAAAAASTQAGDPFSTATQAWSKLLAGKAALPGLDSAKLGEVAGVAQLAQAWRPWLGAAANAQSLGNPDLTKGLEPVGQAVGAMGQSLGATLQSLAGLNIPAEQLQSIQQDYLQQASQLWNQALQQPDAVKVSDKRFASPEWSQSPGSAFMASMYLLNARTLQRLADNLSGDDKARQRVRFAVQQWADAASPANFLAFNPEALSKALSTKGESLTQGLGHLLNDIRQGHMSQTDESVFEVGVNVATTQGSVVYENPYFQLIEYKPLTAQVHEVPFLFVPPCINKYYILDLQPENSLVRYLLSQGHRVFMVSWVNADDSLAKSTWDDYVEHGVTRAIDVTREVTGADQVNALGFCVGGTLLATALATLAAQGRKPVRSLTLLTAFLDFVNTGTMDVFVDEAMVRMREMTMGADSPMGGGLLRGNELAATFSFLRANDLVWNYVIGNYLKGELPPAFDLLYWNSDSTNLPGPMYTWYLRNTYLENKLCKPGAVKVCGVPLDMRRLDMPTFIYGSREDHIVPWDSAYASSQVVSGPKTFVLGASGHIAGVINPPEKKKRSHWVSSARTLPATAQAWMETASEQPGSWWPAWSGWLAEQAGKMVPAPKQPGSRQHPVIEAAPGRYVKRKA